MHVKSLIFDSKVVCDGSVNMSHNGHERNKEHLYRITAEPVVAQLVKDFEKDWLKAEKVTQKEIDSMIAIGKKAEEAKKQK